MTSFSFHAEALGYILCLFRGCPPLLLYSRDRDLRQASLSLSLSIAATGSPASSYLLNNISWKNFLSPKNSVPQNSPFISFIHHCLITFQLPTVVGKPPHLPSSKKSVIKIKSLSCLARELPCQGPPILAVWGNSQNSSPLIKIAIPVKKIITKAWAVTMTLYSWSFPNEGPDWPCSLRIRILSPVPSIPLHAPVIKYRIPRLIIEYRSRAVLNSLLTRTPIKWGNGPL